MENELLKIGTFRTELYESEPKTVKDDLPVMVYDENDLLRWQDRVRNGGFSDMTVRSIHTVNGDSVPIRWLTTLIDTARLFEGLQGTNHRAPKVWKLMAPIHINTLCNEGDMEMALDTATRLEDFAQEYILAFHPEVPIPEMETDNPTAVPDILKQGEQLYPLLPPDVQEDLQRMSGNHSNGNNNSRNNAGYLLAHYSAYGLVRSDLFPKRGNTLFILPQSEGRFIDMMDQSKDAVKALGIISTDFTTTGSVLTMSHHLRTPHYYPHTGERDLLSLSHPQQWPTRNQLHSQRGLNGFARTEIESCLKAIEEDIGGKQNLPQLIDIIQSVS